MPAGTALPARSVMPPGWAAVYRIFNDTAPSPASSLSVRQGFPDLPSASFYETQIYGDCPLARPK